MQGSQSDWSGMGVQVGDTIIPEAEIAREMQYHRARDPQAARGEAARALVVRELLRLEAERLGLGATVQPIGTETPEDACVRVLLEREVSVPAPDEAACRRGYGANRDRLRGPDRACVRHILLAAATDDVEGRRRARELGEELIGELRRHPERFAELAARHSACPSRTTGGELGWIEPGTTVPEFERQVLPLEVGLAGLTVESRWGHHVVAVDAVERGAPLEYEEAAPKVAAYLEAQARQRAIHEFLQRLAARYRVRGMPAGGAGSPDATDRIVIPEETNTP